VQFVSTFGSGSIPEGKEIDPIGLALLLPAMLLVAVLFVAPICYAFYLGLTNITLIGATAINFRFTGSANIVRLFHDRLFWESVKLTAIFIGCSSVIGSTTVGMALAVLMRRVGAWLRMAVGTIVILAWMLPPVTAAIVWYAFTQDAGPVSFVVGDNADLLGRFPMLIVCIANVWSTAGFSMLVIGAGLRSVPNEAIEAAVLEGASRWQVFSRITIPIIRPTIVTNILLVSLLGIGNFSLIYILTRGGPGDATEILPIYSYQQGFEFNNLGYGALVGSMLVIAATVLAYFYVRISFRRAPAARGGAR
jgi:multiple sugar transport system permease protein